MEINPSTVFFVAFELLAHFELYNIEMTPLYFSEFLELS